MVKYLGQRSCSVTTLDNLSGGHRDAVLSGEFIQGDLADTDLLHNLIQPNRFDAIMHFASFIQVGESAQNPAIYYQNNVVNTLKLLEAMRAAGLKRFIFSSTAAIFGEPHYTPIDERHPRYPINPYGRSKYMVEQMLEDFDKAYGMKSVCLRYFNAAGCDPDGELGERHDPETHLIPLVLQAAAGRREALSVFGRDYDTPDGTCIRDYIHVTDLCEAHFLALQTLMDGTDSDQFNLGNGKGFSVQEVIDTSSRVTQKKINVSDAPRREGDPACLVADSSMARSKLGWQPKYSDLEMMISHAWAWEQKR